MNSLKIKTLLSVFLSLFSVVGFSQSYIVATGNCNTSSALSVGPSSGVIVNQTTSQGWFNFVATDPTMFVDLNKLDSSFVSVDSVYVYGSSCGSLNTIDSTKNGSPSDSTFLIELKIQNLVIGNTYFIKVTRNSSLNPITSNYKLSVFDIQAASCNLIINGDFETAGCPSSSTPGCPPAGSGIIPNWVQGSQASADYWNTCNTGTVVNPSTNGGVPPHSGAGYGGLYGGTHDAFLAPYNSGYEYLRTGFSSLVGGDKYYVQMFYARATNSDWRTDGLGIRLNNGPPTNTSSISFCALCITPPVSPQVQNPSGNIISNSNWLPLSGIVTAGGGENTMVIGNFKAPTAYTYTYNLNNRSGAYYFIDDVSITPLKMTFTGTNFCQGQSTQLVATTCEPPYTTSTYQWFPSTGLSNPNILNPIANPSGTTTYTLVQTITNAAGQTYTTSGQTTVVVSPIVVSFVPQTDCKNPLGYSFTPSVLCNGFNFTPSSYLWNFGDGLTSTVSIPSHVYTSPGTYTVSLTVTSGTVSITTTQTITVSVTPADIKGAPMTLCQLNTINSATYTLVSPNPTATYNWTITAGCGTLSLNVPWFPIGSGNSVISLSNYANVMTQLTNAQNAQVVFTPTMVICVFDPVCQITNCITLSGCCKRVSGSDDYSAINLTNVTFVAPGTSGSTAFPTGTTSINNLSGLVAIPSNSVITKKMYVMGTLSVSTNVSFNNSRFIFNEAVPMYVNTGSSTTYSYSTLTGCNYMWQGVTNNGKINVVNSDIYDANKAFSEASNSTTLTVSNSLFNRNKTGIFLNQTPVNTNNFYFRGSIITSRNINEKSFNPPLAAALVSGSVSIVIGPALSGSYTPANTKGSPVMGIPVNYQPSNYGIYAQNIPMTNTLVIGLTQGLSQGGTNNRSNWFDRTYNSGVFVQNTSASLVNNNFQNMLFGPTTIGNGITAINATNPSASTKPTVNIGVQGSNPSINQFNAVTNGLMASKEGRLNFVNNRLDANANTGVTIQNWYATTPNTYSANINFNTFNNCFYDVFAYDNQSIKANINGNSSTHTGLVKLRQYINVILAELNKPKTALYSVIGNSFIGKIDGVYSINTYSPIIGSNFIRVRPPVSGIYTGNFNAPIWLDNTDMGGISTNTVDVSPTQSSSFNTFGIFSNICVNNTYNCNVITGAGSAMKFQGSCPSIIYTNQLNNKPTDPCLFGVFLDNSGYTGPIYFPFFVFIFIPFDGDNIFGDFNYGAGGADTYVQNFSNGSFIPYAGAPIASNNFYPLVNNAQAGLTAYTPTSNPFSGFLGCGVGIPNGRISQGIPPFFGNSQNFGPNTTNVVSIARKSITEFLRKSGVTEADLTGTTAFNNTMLGTNTGTFFITDSLTNSSVTNNNSSDLTQARNLNLVIAPTDNIESNQKLFNSIYHSYLSNPSAISESDLNDLRILAAKCPFTDGTSVYQARAFLMPYDSTSYINACEFNAPPNSSSRFTSNANAGVEIDNPHSIETKVYPNPASDELTVVTEAVDARIIIYNILGVEVINEAIPSTLKLNVKEIPSGTYLYKITVDGITVKNDKLIINK